MVSGITSQNLEQIGKTLIFYFIGKWFEVKNEVKTAQNRPKTFFEHNGDILSSLVLLYRHFLCFKLNLSYTPPTPYAKHHCANFLYHVMLVLHPGAFNYDD